MRPPFVKLGDVVDVLSGFAFKSEFFNDSDGLPVIRIRDVVRGYTDTYYTGPYTEQFVVRDGDILIGMDGNFNAAKWRGGRALLNQRVCKVTARASLLDEAYLFHYLPIALRRIEDATPFVTVKHLSASDLREERIPLPPLAEQRRIAAILDKADVIRAKRREALAQLDRLAQSIFVEMFGDPLTSAKRWPIVEIGAVANVQGGLQVTAARSRLPVEVPYLRVANVYRGRLDLGEVKTIRATANEVGRTKLLADDMLVVEGHGNPEEVGRAALWNGEVENCVHQNHLIRVRFDPTRVAPTFACAYVNSAGGRQHLSRAGKTTSGLNTISVSNVRAVPIPLPALAAQKTYATRVAEVGRLKRMQYAAEIEGEALFSALQHRAFQGEL